MIKTHFQLKRLSVVMALALFVAPLAFAQAFDATGKKQVNVSVKIVEFQTTKGMETGLSAYFARRNTYRAYGRISSGNGAVSSADITFPTSTAAGITVFLDRLHMTEGDLEMVLEALVNQNRALIRSQPRAMVVEGDPVGSEIKLSQRIPYEKTQVVGAAPVQVTSTRDAGVSLKVSVPQIIDDDGDWSTGDDTYVQLNLHAEVSEEGQKLTVALDDQLASGGEFSLARNALQAPEFITRKIDTKVWVRNGQVLILGGLYRNTKNKNLATLPWLARAEEVAEGLAGKLVPWEWLASPVSATVGSRAVNEGRRELVFLIKAEVWKPAFTVIDRTGLSEEEGEAKPSPKDLITGVIDTITAIPQEVTKGIVGQPKDEVESSLGGGK